MKIERLEELRNKIKKCYINYIICTSVIILLLIVNKMHFFILLAMIFPIKATYKKNVEYKKEYKKEYKNYFVSSVLEEYFTDLKYDFDRGIPYEVVDSTEMINMGGRDIYFSNDYVSGKYKDIYFEQADVHIEEKHGKSYPIRQKKKTYVNAIFRGRWMIFDFNKTFKSNVQILQKGFGSSKVQHQLQVPLLPLFYVLLSFVNFPRSFLIRTTILSFSVTLVLGKEKNVIQKSSNGVNRI